MIVNVKHDGGLSFRRAFKFSLALFFFMAVFTSCSPLFGDELVQWKEIVNLSNGQQLVVERSFTLSNNVPREIGQGPRAIGDTLKFTLPGTQNEAIWDNANAIHPRNTLAPMLLDIDHDTFYLATSPMMAIDYARWKCPSPRYVFFKYQNGWQRISFDEFPSQFRTVNILYFDNRNAKEIKGRTLTPEQVEKLNRPGGIAAPSINPKLRSPDGCEVTHIINEQD